MLLLDTNVVSELRKVSSRRTDPNFIAWSKDLRWADLFISSVTIYEIEVGIAQLAEYDKVQAAHLRAWFRDQLLPKFATRILPIDATIAMLGGQLQVSRTRQVEDTLIAATAQVHRMKVVTRNVRDFEDAGVELIDPWNPQQR